MIDVQQLAAGKHAFISYVHEDSGRVDELETQLQSVGIKVWRDKNDLWPGQDWELVIREAITNDNLAFIACFSEASHNRVKSYQNEELVVAIEEFRKRHPDRPWIFPVRFDDIPMPKHSLGASRTLDSLHRTDLFGAGEVTNLLRLVHGVQLLLYGSMATAPTSAPAQTEPGETRIQSVKRLLRDPRGDIAIEEIVGDLVDDVRRKLQEQPKITSVDTRTTVGTGEAVIASVGRTDEIMRPLLEVLALAGRYGEPQHDHLWEDMARGIASAQSELSGLNLELELNRYSTLCVLYVVAIAATARGNFSPLRAVTSDATVRVLNGSLPLSGFVNVRYPLHSASWTGTAITFIDAAGRGAVTAETLERIASKDIGNRHTPLADHLHDHLRPLFAKTIRDDAHYSNIFDRAEILLDLIAMDTYLQRPVR